MYELQIKQDDDNWVCSHFDIINEVKTPVQFSCIEDAVESFLCSVNFTSKKIIQGQMDESATVKREEYRLLNKDTGELHLMIDLVSEKRYDNNFWGGIECRF